MEIHIALLECDGQRSPFIVGAFSSEDKARAACQGHADEVRDSGEWPRFALTWRKGSADFHGDTYRVDAVDFDERMV